MASALPCYLVALLFWLGAGVRINELAMAVDKACTVSIFIYDLPWPFDDTKAPPTDNASLTKQYEKDLWRFDSSVDYSEDAVRQRAFGQPLLTEEGGTSAELIGVFDALDSHVLNEVVHWRLSRSSCLVDDPTKADVLVVPLFMRAKSGDTWRQKCKSFADGNGLQDLMPHLEHLTSSTARRHVIFQGHFGVRECVGWYMDPIEELKEVRRVASGPHAAGPDVLSIPYSSTVHWSASYSGDPPWKKVRDRPVLMALASAPREKVQKKCLLQNTAEECCWGGMNAEECRSRMKWDDKLYQMRNALAHSCESAGDNCISVDLDGVDVLGSGSIGVVQHIVHAYQTAEFCLQPIGDSCERKGILDSLLLGCIPVIFDECQKHVWSLHWDSRWHNESMVFIDGSSYLGGEVDLKAKLADIPLDQREAMRTNIRHHGHRLQYALEDPVDGQDDALTIALKALSES